MRNEAAADTTHGLEESHLDLGRVDDGVSHGDGYPRPVQIHVLVGLVRELLQHAEQMAPQGSDVIVHLLPSC